MDLSSELSFIVSISEFFLVIDSIDGLALFSHFHEQIRVIIGLFAVEADICGSIDLEIFIDFLANCLLMQSFSMNSHLLNDKLLTETGSLTLASFPGLLS